MNPIVALGIVGAGAVVLFLTSRRGTLGAAGCQPLTPEAITALTVYNQRPSAAQSAIAGASAGASLAVATWGISIGVGAAAGYLTRSRSNDTLADRRTFAANLGFSSLDQLFLALDKIDRHDLSQQALNVIGRQDHAANEAWMRDVLIAFVSAGYCL